MRVRIKICCIQNMEEVEMAIRYGASAVGLVGEMPSGPGVISDDAIREIAAQIPPPIASFLLTSKTGAEDIIAHHRRTHTHTIQIVDHLQDRQYRLIRQECPQLKLVQVIHVQGQGSVEEAMEVAPHVDALLLDSGNPQLRIKELGGTGRVHNWDLSREIREKINIPVFLAGGLNSSNVRKAIDTVKPFGVDVCTGVRTDGRLDENKLADFVRAIDCR